MGQDPGQELDSAARNDEGLVRVVGDDQPDDTAGVRRQVALDIGQRLNSSADVGLVGLDRRDGEAVMVNLLLQASIIRNIRNKRNRFTLIAALRFVGVPWARSQGAEVEASGFVGGAFGGAGSGVADEDVGAGPAGDGHEAGFGAAGGEPAVGGGVPEPVGPEAVYFGALAPAS